MEDVSYEVQDDGGLLYAVQRRKDGSLTAHVRVYGRVLIDGVEYEYDHQPVKVRLRKCKGA